MIMLNREKNNKPFFSKIVMAGTWALSGYVAAQAFRLISNLIMTRLLVPEMFGIMALTQVFLYIMTLISDIGIGPNIIRSDRGHDPKFLNTAWVIQIIRGAIVFIGVVLIAQSFKLLNTLGLIMEGSAYADPQLPLLISVMGITALISGFKSTNLILANKNLLIGRLTIIELITQFLGILFMIIWALIDKSIWALVAGAVSSSILNTVLSHIAFPGDKNRFYWDKSAFWEIFHFGKWLLLSSIITAILAQGDRLILGNLLSAEQLGIYSIAYFLVQSVKQALFKVNNMVFFPVLSQIKNESSDKISRVYYKIRKNTDAIAMMSAGFLFISSEQIINILYDDRYSEAGWMLSILSLTLIITGHIISGAMYFAIGKPQYVSSMVAIETLVLLTGVPLMFFYGGLNWAIWLLALFSICAYPLDFYYKKKLGILQIIKEFYMLPCVFVGMLIGLLFVKVMSFIVT